MSKKICVFVDGENFRHAICGLFEKFNQSDYLPRNADWGAFFDWLAERASPGGERIRTYWYVVNSLDFSPNKLCDANRETDRLKEILCRDEKCELMLKNLTGEDLKREMIKICKDLDTRRQAMARRFAGWENIQSSISTKYKFIEFRKAGAIRYSLFEKSLGNEKAVDVKLATDMIVLKDIYDISVIVSGDQDYVPAVQVIKDVGKHVINVSFQKRNGELLPGGAFRLNQLTDWNLKVTHGELSKYLKL